MRQFKSIPAAIARSMTFLFTMGSIPGMPPHAGQTDMFCSTSRLAEHEQNIFELVASSACTSSPMTISYAMYHTILSRAAAAVNAFDSKSGLAISCTPRRATVGKPVMLDGAVKILSLKIASRFPFV